jgi:membrane associated rhomboid family serine protease
VIRGPRAPRAPSISATPREDDDHEDQCARQAAGAPNTIATNTVKTPLEPRVLARALDAGREGAARRAVLCYPPDVSRQRRARFDVRQLRITRGALGLLFAQVGLSLVWLLSDVDVRAAMANALVPTAGAVWRDGKIWTLVTGAVLETSFPSLLLGALVLWWFVPTLERWWGLRRFLIFALATSLVGTVLGTLTGLATGRDAPIAGYDPFIYASIVAFGILYGRQPVQFFGVLPMTGRQLMYGIIGFVALFVLLGRQWELAVGYAGAMVTGALLASGKWSPRLWWYRWRHARVRRRLAVLDGGKGRRAGGDDKLVN